MRFIFWGAVAWVAYTYFGYMAGLWLRSHWRARPVQSGPHLPSVSIVLVVHNEELNIDHKLQNLEVVDYPAELLEIIVVSDGSTDRTNRALSEFANNPRARVILQQQPQGKAAGLNLALKAASGDIVVFTDARQTIARDAVLRLMENFADPSVGCVSGELTLGDPVSGETVKGLGLYWKIEKLTRVMESAAGSVVGATGALYAVRRSLLVSLPPEIILDDVFIPMQVVRQGARVVFDPRAKIWDTPDMGTRREFARKVRTLSGIYQLLQLEPWLLSGANPIWFQFVSHKVFRLAVPFALFAALVSSMLLSAPIYRVAMVLQLAFYSLSVCGPVRLGRNPLARAADVAFTFVLLNAAAVVAFAHFVAGRKPAWGR